jgi:predicted ribosome-associated RNA-binding protein Tma20
VHEDIIGVITASGKPVAFQRSKALVALKSGEKVGVEDIQLVLDGGGIRAVNAQGDDLGSHQAFWFAWSQFHPSTGLWQ